MFQQKKDWETRENAFAAFSMGPLTDFWRQREEDEFMGVGDIPVRFVRFHDEKNDRVIVVCPGASKAISNMPSWRMTCSIWALMC